uniref:ADP-ribosylation factor-like protein 6 n=1 Tax=Clytia hemisphaerica TaxID=252671 RepID=A0A7M6DJ51_9CNID|eukprot:TCONS_00010642-protein
MLNSLRDCLGLNKRTSLLLLGINSAGKTSILYRLLLGELMKVIPTVGFQSEDILHNGNYFRILDIGGGCKIPPLWRHYFEHYQGIIYVVDSTSRDYIEETKSTLYHCILIKDEAQHYPIIVFANKQDLPNAMSTLEITEKLELNEIKDRSWHIQGTSASTGEGLYEGLDWIYDEIQNKKQD